MLTTTQTLIPKFPYIFLIESILAIVKNNGLTPVVTMVASTHSIMQNEALVGIALAVNIINSTSIVNILVM